MSHMYTLTYRGNKAAVVENGRYIYEFETEDAARQAVKQAEMIVVIFQPGNRDQEMEKTPAVEQAMSIKLPTEAKI